VAQTGADLAAAWVAIDQDSEATRACGAVSEAIDARVGDMRNPPVDGLEPFDLVVCLGNTLTLLWDVDETVAALRCWRSVLRSDGLLVIDDLADDLWPELVEGNWCTGFDEEGQRQMVWAPDDAVFAIREGGAVDLNNWSLGEGDVRMRLWTTGALRLAAIASGWGPPERLAERGVMVMRPAPSGTAQPGT